MVTQYCAAQLALPFIELDTLGHAVLDEPSIRKTLGELVPEARNPDGSLNRGILGQRVFADTSLLSRLNALTHPRILSHARDQIKTHQRLLITGALLHEIGLAIYCDVIIVIDRDTPAILDSVPKAAQILPHQASRAVYQARADAIIMNTTQSQCEQDALALLKRLKIA